MLHLHICDYILSYPLFTVNKQPLSPTPLHSYKRRFSIALFHILHCTFILTWRTPTARAHTHRGMFSKHKITKILCLITGKPTIRQTSTIVKVCYSGSPPPHPQELFHFILKPGLQVPQHLGSSLQGLLLPGPLPPL